MFPCLNCNIMLKFNDSSAAWQDLMKLQEVPNCHNVTVTIWKWRTKNDNDQINYVAIRKGSSRCFIRIRISNSNKTVRSAKTSKSEKFGLSPLPRYVGTCKIVFEIILDTIHKSGLLSLTRVAFINPMLVPKHANNYQYRYGAAQYWYWYPYSNSLVFSFLSQFFQSTIEFTSLGSE
jgi:hypothetical protein